MAENQDHQNLSCINCSETFKIDQDGGPDLSIQTEGLKFFREIQVSLLPTTCSNDPDQKVEENDADVIIMVYDALSSIFNLHRLMTGEKLRNQNKDQLVICSDCREVLTNLYKYYDQFSHLRRSNSFLAQQLHDLDKMLDQVSIPVCVHPNEDDDVKPDIIDSCPADEYDDDCMAMEFCEPHLEVDGLYSDEDVIYKDPPVTSFGPGPLVNLVRLSPADILKAITTTTTRRIKIYRSTDDKSGSYSSPVGCDENDEDCNYNETKLGLNNVSSPSNSRLQRSHNLHKNDGKIFECTICDKTFSRADGLKIHHRIHSNEKPYICPVCGAKFSQNTLFHKHRRKMHPDEKVLKPIFQSINHPGEKDVKPIISSSAISQPSTNLAEQGDHGVSKRVKQLKSANFKFTKKRKNIHRDTSKKSTWSCTICDKTFSRADALRIHQRIHTLEKPYSCPICGMRFNQNSAFHHHRRSLHPDENAFLKPVYTRSSSKSKKLLKGEMVERLFSCELCDRSYRQAKNLKSHQKKIHDLVVPIQKVAGDNNNGGPSSEQSKPDAGRCLCPICGVTFDYKSRLDGHMLVHQDVRNYTCKTCDMSFKCLSNLTRHEKVHAEVKALLCTECGKTFRGTQGLKIHMQTHTGEKPYQCKLCDEAFGYNQMLKKHLVKTHGKEYEHLAGISHRPKSRFDPSKSVYKEQNI